MISGPILIGAVLFIVVLVIIPSGTSTEPRVEEPKGFNEMTVLQSSQQGNKETTLQTGNRRLQQTLARREKELDLREKKIVHIERKLELSFKELSLERKSVATEMEKLFFEEQQSIFKIRGAMQVLQDKVKHFDFSKREFNLFIKGKELQDYDRSLKHLEATINEKHRQAKKDLDLEARESKHNLKERRLALDTHFSNEIDKVRNMKFQANTRELQQIKRDISQDAKDKFLLLMQKEFDHKQRVIEAYESHYYVDGKEAFRRAYNNFGFDLKNPVIDENKILRKKLNLLSQQTNQ